MRGLLRNDSLTGSIHINVYFYTNLVSTLIGQVRFTGQLRFERLDDKIQLLQRSNYRPGTSGTIIQTPSRID